MNNDDLIQDILERGINDPKIIHAFAQTSREMFVPEQLCDHAYEDHPILLPFGQTVSQPTLVATMTQMAMCGPSLDNILEIGTGSGYQACILSFIFNHVHTVERIHSLYHTAQQTLNKLNRCPPVQCHFGDGYQGWLKAAPYDAIIVTAAPIEVPPALLEQLKDHGKLVIPIGPGPDNQQIKIYTRIGNEFQCEDDIMVRFVPMLPDQDSR